MSQEKPESFDLEQFNLEFKGKAGELVRTYNALHHPEGEYPSGEEEIFLKRKFDSLYKEAISFLAEACINSDRNPEVFKKVAELMNLWISPDNDIPVFSDEGADVLKDFTDELLNQVANPDESGSRDSIKEVLRQN